MPKLRMPATSRLSLVCCLVFLISLFPLTTALAEPSFNNDAFKMKWQRADKAVNEGTSRPPRSWLWGPEGFGPVGGAPSEEYSDSPGGRRPVQYFDKARMELNNPSSGLVTNGLLVRELISGKLATGHSAFFQRMPADVPVGGDPTGNDGPTYASFTNIASLNNDNPSSSRTGQPVTDSIGKGGNVVPNGGPANQLKLVYFDPNLKHNIPDVFWNFINQRGNIFVNGQVIENQPVLGDDPNSPWVDAMGLPITEAYWSKFTVAGRVVDVLVQAFERRILTFTPSNPEQYRVEMGNVGRHYFTWRYSGKYNLPVSPPTSTTPVTNPVVASCKALPPATNRAFAFTPCGAVGMQIIVGMNGLTAGEKVTVTPVTSAGDTRPALTSTADSAGSAQAKLDTLLTDPAGLWSFRIKGLTSGKEGVAYVYLGPAVSRPTLFVFPEKGDINTLFALVVVGFQPNEFITPNLTTRDNFSANANNIQVNSAGGVTISFQLSRDVPIDYGKPGTYKILFSAEKDGNRYVQATIEIAAVK